MQDDFTKNGVNKYAKTRYSKADQRFAHWREETILRKYLRRAAGDSDLILDIPCGYGRFSPFLFEFSSGDIGSDRSLSTAAHALNRQPRSLHRQRGVVGDAVKGMPFKSEAFMGVVSIRLFQHLQKRGEREAALEEFARLSRRFVILSYYRRNALHIVQRRLRRWLKSTQTTINMVPVRNS